MTSKQVKARPLTKNVSSIRSKNQRLSAKSKQDNPSEMPLPVPIVTKKPFTTKEKELLEACESGDLDAVYYYNLL